MAAAGEAKQRVSAARLGSISASASDAWYEHILASAMPAASGPESVIRLASVSGLSCKTPGV
eukprot:1184990-Prorocentrum_minimum.AAC.2